MTATGELLARLADNATVRRVYGEPCCLALVRPHRHI